MDFKRYENYYLGLDIGTESVGWAVTDEKYNVIRKKGKSLWGIRLFDEAQTAAERRTYRTGRRRNERKKQRILLLQELFSKEIDRIDNKFFARLRDSAYWSEDKAEEQIYSLFNDKDFNDVNYHKEYPTIYHLRKSLLTEDKKHDIRLLYLAIHHIMKNRGHFLFTGNVGNVTAFENTYNEFKCCMEDDLDIEWECQSVDKFEEILKQKGLRKTKKCSEIEKLCNITKNDKQAKEVIKLIVGLKASLSVIFDDNSYEENEHNKICFSDAGYEDIRDALDDEIQEKAFIIDTFQNVYNWIMLSDVLEGGEYGDKYYLSVAKVNLYEKHKKDLKLLKHIVKEYLPKEYKAFFEADGKNNYCAYVGGYLKNGKRYDVKSSTNKNSKEKNSKEKNRKEDEFYKGLKALIKKIDVDNSLVEEIKNEVDNKTFLPRQVSINNGIIPYQINKMELCDILKNAEKYYPFLSEADESCGKTVSEKIISIFEFRVPYYVGPLNQYSKNAWFVRNNDVDEKIRPWNFDKVVDLDKSAAEFKNRMTNQCTYLTEETVLPKYSLLYCEFMVLNELNNVKIKGEKLPVSLKQEIFENLFKSYKQITPKRLLDYLNSLGMDVQKSDISGIDGNFKSALSSYIDLKNNVFGEDINKYSVQKMAEDIILWVTLYADAPNILKRVVKKNYPDIDDKQLKKISKLKFNGWGRLSRAFLNGIEGIDSETGEIMTIIQGLRNSQNNLMQLLSQRYSFGEEIDKANGSCIPTDEVTYDNMVKDIVASPSIKRAIWQTIQIVEEIKEIMGQPPKRIFVETARGKVKDNNPKDSRKSRLVKLYKKLYDNTKDENIKALYDEIRNTENSKFKNIKLYLYYTQLGKCIYTGKDISLSEINNVNIWDKDHIYPQSKTKDDSLDNLVFSDKPTNAAKGNKIVSEEIRKNMYGFWKQLNEYGLISDKKFTRLTRTTPLTDEELAEFINRQLVETRQSSKIIANLLNSMYADTDIVYVKAKTVSDFRKDKKCEYGVKVRSVNDFHHAKDAYLNIVVGNVYFNKFTNNPLHWLKGNKDKNYSLNRMFDFDIENKDGVVWKKGKDGSIKTVNEYLKRNDVLYTRYAYCNKGGLFDQMPVKAPAKKGTGEKLVPRKSGLDTSKYGGYNSVTSAYFSLIESKGKNGKAIRSIEVVPLYRAKDFEKDESKFLEYCEKIYGLKEPRVILPKIKKNALLIINGFPMHLKGSTGMQLVLQGAVQLCIDYDMVVYVKKIEKHIEANKKANGNELLKVDEYTGINKEDNIRLYNTLLNKLENTIYKLRPANISKKLTDKKDVFINLTLENQCVVLNELLKIFQCKPLAANLKLLDEPEKSGITKVSKTISNCSSALLVHQSPTGVFEHTVDLLKL